MRWLPNSTECRNQNRTNTDEQGAGKRVSRKGFTEYKSCKYRIEHQAGLFYFLVNRLLGHWETQ